MLVTTNPNAPLHGDYRDFSKGGRYGPTGANAPVQTGREGGRNQFDYWETDPAKVNAYLKANANDPKIKAAAQRGSEALDYELHSRGIRVPEKYKAGFDPNGGGVIVKEMNYWDKHKHWIIPATVVAGAAVAPYAYGALAGGAPAAAPAASSGVLPSTVIGTGAVPAVAGTSSVLPAATSAILPTLASTTIGTGAVPAVGATVQAGGTGILSAYDRYRKMASSAGDVFRGASDGLATGRRDDDDADMMAADRNNRAQVDAAQFNLNVPLTRAQQVARGDMMAATVTPVSHTGSGRDLKFTGGMETPFGPDTTKAGEELKRQALLKLMDPASDQLTPQIVTPRKPGKAENITGMFGTATSILDAYNNYRGGR